MIYILCFLFSFIIGLKISKVYSNLQLILNKKKLDAIEIEERVEKKYKKKLDEMQKKIDSYKNIIEEDNEE